MRNSSTELKFSIVCTTCFNVLRFQFRRYRFKIYNNMHTNSDSKKYFTLENWPRKVHFLM